MVSESSVVRGPTVICPVDLIDPVAVFVVAGISQGVGQHVARRHHWPPLALPHLVPGGEFSSTFRPTSVVSAVNSVLIREHRGGVIGGRYRPNHVGRHLLRILVRAMTVGIGCRYPKVLIRNT